MSEQITSDGIVWTYRGGDTFTATNDNGDVIRALRSDLVDDDEVAWQAGVTQANEGRAR